MTTAADRQPPPPLFDKPRASSKPLTDQLGDFVPKTDADFPDVMVPPAAKLAAESGHGRQRRRGQSEARSKQAPVRLTPTEFHELNALCDKLDMSYPDAIMFLVRQYKAANS